MEGTSRRGKGSVLGEMGVPVVLILGSYFISSFVQWE